MENNPLSYRRGFDTSVLTLLISNIFTIYYASVHTLSLMEVMLVYLVQTLIIGMVNVVRIATLQNVSTGGYIENGSPVQVTGSTKERKALIFALHFGVFLATYTIYLIPDITISLLKVVVVPSLIYFANHTFSYFYNRKQDSQEQSVGVLMFLPYIRILPMHIVLVLAETTGGLTTIFLVLKMIADIVMHIVEHAFLRRKTHILPL